MTDKWWKVLSNNCLLCYCISGTIFTHFWHSQLWEYSVFLAKIGQLVHQRGHVTYRKKHIKFGEIPIGCRYAFFKVNEFFCINKNRKKISIWCYQLKYVILDVCLGGKFKNKMIFKQCWIIRGGVKLYCDFS